MEGQSSRALREHFGDRKPPDISRKITACVACRKQKTKCNMPDGLAPCARCKLRNLSCTVNRSLQMLLESDVDWKNAVTQRLTNLETAMVKMADPTFVDEIHDLLDHAATPRQPLAALQAMKVHPTHLSKTVRMSVRGRSILMQWVAQPQSPRRTSLSASKATWALLSKSALTNTISFREVWSVLTGLKSFLACTTTGLIILSTEFLEIIVL